jgi:hypothetical protein
MVVEIGKEFWEIIQKKVKCKGPASHNRSGLYTLRRQQAARPPQRLGHSATLHSHASFHPHFCAQDSGRESVHTGEPKRRQQPERYAHHYLNFSPKSVKIWLDTIKKTG